LKKAYEIFYWVNPYDTLLDCYLSTERDARMEVASDPKHAVTMLSWRAKLGHTVPCADRRYDMQILCTS
jgi:hypothetical protein